EEGYKEAKGFMKMLMPSHAKVVQPYRDVHPIFSRSGIEAQLDRMLQPQVTLKSGGYIIINQTEALVSIDVNSGRSTREHSIEDTALQTNLEAAEEVARQLRLRDLAGLIVIDFIDMEEKRNNRSVEKKLKDCLKNDRARIQVGRISHFGLLEMSRQRIRASVLESTMQTCPHCNGTGHIRSQSSVALHVLRGIEEHLLKNTTHDISVRTTPDIALYLLNQKRSSITDYEQRFGVSIFIEADAHVGAQHFAIDRGEPVENPVRIDQILQFEPEPEEEEEEEEVLIEEELDDEEAEETAAEHQDQQKGQPDDQGGRKRKRRRRRRGKGAGQGADAVSAESADAAEDEAGDEAAADDAEDELDAADSLNGDSEQKRKRRRRGKRGGRRNRQEELAGSEGETGATAETVEEPGEESVDSTAAEIPAVSAAEEAPADVAAAAAVEGVAEEPKPAKPRRSRKKTTKTEEPAVNADEVAEKVVEAQPEPAEPAPQIVEEAVEEAVEDLEGAKPARSNRDLSAIASKPVVTSSKGESEEEPTKPKKGGWWQRRGFF
ncbi:ribonuclease E/G, partial [Sinorhizobium medicae]